MKYAIKYLKVRFDEDTDVLIPLGLVCGVINNGYFETDKDIYTYITNPILDGKHIIGDAISLDELRDKYESDKYGFTNDEIINFYFNELRQDLQIIQNGCRKSISIFELFDDIDDEKMLYQIIDGESCLVINQKIINLIEDIDDIDTIKNILLDYSDRLANFDYRNKNDGVDTVYVKNASVVEIERNNEINPLILPEEETSKKSSSVIIDEPVEGDFSVEGLLKHLKESIIGHDEELMEIATVLFMNYIATEKYGTESILIPGPTGTGKTATFKCASTYLNNQFIDVNTVNLVPQGYEGVSIEDIFEELIEACSGDIEKAEKSIILFDEFDKLGKDSLDLKQTMSNIFLKVLEGGTFPIRRQLKTTKVFDTTMSSKICVGAFSDAYLKDKSKIGFGTEEIETQIFDEDMLVKKGYFSKELLSRISHFVPYQDLTDEDKKRIILESKISEYKKKKDLLKENFGISIVGDEEFAEGVIDVLKQESKSVRDINRIIKKIFIRIEYELLCNKGKYKTLSLTRNTASRKDYDLK